MNTQKTLEMAVSVRLEIANTSYLSAIGTISTKAPKWAPNPEQRFCKEKKYETIWTKPTSSVLSTPAKTSTKKNPKQTKHMGSLPEDNQNSVGSNTS